MTSNDVSGGNVVNLAWQGRTATGDSEKKVHISRKVVVTVVTVVTLPIKCFKSM